MGGSDKIGVTRAKKKRYFFFMNLNNTHRYRYIAVQKSARRSKLLNPNSLEQLGTVPVVRVVDAHASLVVPQVVPSLRVPGGAVQQWAPATEHSQYRCNYITIVFSALFSFLSSICELLIHLVSSYSPHWT